MSINGKFKRVPLTGKLIEAFAGAYLSPMYDSPAPTPNFHRESWELYASSSILAGVVAPRGHAKSTALTHDFVLAVVCFRAQDYVLIASATEELAIQHLGDIAKELRDNDDLRRDFKIVDMPTDAKTEIVVQFEDGHLARIIAKGSGQKLRGIKWNGKRPGLIVGDDLEEDEQVESYDRRRKFRQWVNRALIPCMRKGGIVRFHGTILHEDSMLARIIKSEEWDTLFYKAHESFDDFSNILWPEMHSEASLRAVRQRFIDDGDAAGYSQEYLNDPFDNTEAYIRREDMIAMTDEDRETSKVVRIGCDWAVSKSNRADRTSFTVGGKDINNLVHVLDQRKGRWGPDEWIEEMFMLDDRWHPEEFIAEGGVIWKTIEPILYAEMRKRDHMLNIRVINPVKDKAVRGTSFKKHSRAGAMRYDKETDWYDEYEAEVLRFTGRGEAVRDDQFDSTAIMIRGFETAADVEEEDFDSEEDMEFERVSRSMRGSVSGGRSSVTGY